MFLMSLFGQDDVLEICCQGIFLYTPIYCHNVTRKYLGKTFIQPLWPCHTMTYIKMYLERIAVFSIIGLCLCMFRERFGHVWTRLQMFLWLLFYAQKVGKILTTMFKTPIVSQPTDCMLGIDFMVWRIFQNVQGSLQVCWQCLSQVLIGHSIVVQVLGMFNILQARLRLCNYLDSLDMICWNYQTLPFFWICQEQRKFLQNVMVRQGLYTVKKPTGNSHNTYLDLHVVVTTQSLTGVKSIHYNCHIYREYLSYSTKYQYQI